MFASSSVDIPSCAVMVAMKAINKGVAMKFMSSMKTKVMKSVALKTAVAKKRSMKAAMSRGTSASCGSGEVSDQLWSADPNLAASLALVPLNANERTNPEKPRTALVVKKDGDDRPIDRHLPPALGNLKTTGHWDGKTSSSLVHYLHSLQERYGFDTDSLMESCKNAKPNQKKPLAQKLILAKNGGELRAVETDFITEKTTRETKRGWCSAFEVWDQEKIPCVPETQALRIACLAVLERKPHDNPLRAKLGEFMFDYEKKQMESRKLKHGKDVRASAASKLKDDADLGDAQKAIKRSFAATDDVGDKPAPKKRAKVQPDLETMNPQQRKIHTQFEAKKAWIKDAKSAVAKLGKEEASITSSLKDMSKFADIPARIVTEVKSHLSLIQKSKTSLNAKINSENTTAVNKFTGTEYKNAKIDAMDLVKGFNDADNSHKKAKRALSLAKLG